MSHNRIPYFLTGQPAQTPYDQPPPSTGYITGYPPPIQVAIPPPDIFYPAPLAAPPCDLTVPPPGASQPCYDSSTASHYASDYSQSSSYNVPASAETLMPPPSASRSSSYLDEIRRYEDWKRKFGDDRHDTRKYEPHRSLSVNSYDRRSPTRMIRDRSVGTHSSRDNADRRNNDDMYWKERRRLPLHSGYSREGRRNSIDRHRRDDDHRKGNDRDRREVDRTVSPLSSRSLRKDSKSGSTTCSSRSTRDSSSSSFSSSRSLSARSSRKSPKRIAEDVQKRFSSTRIVETPARDKIDIKVENREINRESCHRTSRYKEQLSPKRRDRDRHSKSMSHGSLKAEEYSRSGSIMQRKSIFVDSRSSRKRSPDPSSFRQDTREKDKAKVSNKDIILEKYRKNFCKTSQEYINQMEKLFQENQSDDEDERKWYRSSPAELYYKRSETIVGLVEGSQKDIDLTENIFLELIERGRKERPEVEELPPSKVYKAKLCKHKLEKSDSTSDSNENDNEDIKDEADRAMHELQRKQKHPRRLHPEMWFNTAGEMNDGPACRCSAKTRRTGIRHSVYEGETVPPHCDPNSNNFDKLYHYRIVISPPTNFLIKNPTIITHDDHEFLFSGFSILSHYPLGELPECKVIRFNIEYTIIYEEDKTPLNFTIKELDLFQEFLFIEVLELVDLNLGIGDGKGCTQFHFIPRFIRNLPEGGCEVLSMCEVLKYLLSQSGPLVTESDLTKLHNIDQHAWQKIVDDVKGMIVTFPGKKPCSVRVDQLDRNPPEDYKDDTANKKSKYYPEIVHFGIRPPEISYAGNPGYQKALRYYVKYRHLVANMAKPSWEERRRLVEKGAHLQTLRTLSRMKRDVTVAVSSKGFHLTGLMCDVVQHAMLIPVLVCHLRFHNSLKSLEDTLQYKFVNRRHLQLALTHPSYRENFGTNPDHARNSLTNCGIRQPKYGDRRIHYMNTRKRGINTLINIMSRFGKKRETESAISHNERLEFLGDAVVEFLTSIHLFKMFPGLEEGGLATYRAAIVQNQHLALLAKKLNLDKYMLYAHGSDLCHDLDLRHAMANCFEALIGALFLDGGIEVADKAFALALWHEDDDMLQTWTRERLHLLQEQEPLGDRKYIKDFEFLQKLAKFEESIGVYFKHIRLLARAFTDRSVGYTNLTLGSNQRLEFLGDTVLQLVVSDKLYRHFPEHHEGHLSLLRSSLVNNRTQSVVCDDLNMAAYAVYHSPKAEPSTKGKADLLEAFLGALYLDKGIEYCTVFCNAVLFPRLQEFILNQDWNDPKSKLQQCCLTLRTMDGGEPDIPIYKVIECLGPTNTRVYTVAVYFRGNRLATASGHSIQEAEMNAAKNALACGKELFPQLDHQKRVIAERVKNHRRTRNRRGAQKMNAHSGGVKNGKFKATKKAGKVNKADVIVNDISNKNLPRAYKLGKGADSDDNLSDVSEAGKVSDASRKSSFARSSSDDDAENSEPIDDSITVVDKSADNSVICGLDECKSSHPEGASINENNLDIEENYLEPVASEDEKGFEDIETANLEDGEIPSDSSM